MRKYELDSKGWERPNFGGTGITIITVAVGFVPKLVYPCLHWPCWNSNRPLSTWSGDGVGNSLQIGPTCDLVQSFEIGGPDFVQLRTFESNCVPNASKLKYMSLTIIPHLCSKDSPGKVGRNSRSCESSFLGATVMGMLMTMST